jgi:hypothetical protein
MATFLVFASLILGNVSQVHAQNTAVTPQSSIDRLVTD